MILTVELLSFIATLIVTAIMGALWLNRQFSALRKEIYDNKLYAAENFATNDGMTKSLDRVHTSLDHLADRIDELITKKRLV